MHFAALDGIEAGAVTVSPMAWLETHGALLRKFPREIIHKPKANKMQRILDEIIQWCERNGIPCRIVGLKARQVGLSSGAMAIGYHACRRRSTNFLLIGDEYEKSVQNLEDMFWRCAENDTYAWGSDFNRPSGTFTNGSEFHTDTANDNRAGASGTYQFITATEVAHWKNTKTLSAEKVFQAFMSCVPKVAGTVVIVESTANGEGNIYHQIYCGAITFADLKAGRIPPGWNGFVKIFYAWHEHPEYTAPCTPLEAMQIMATLSDREKELVEQFPATMTPGRLKWRRATIAGADFRGNEQKFEEEFPSDETSAFLNSGGKVFPARQVKSMVAKAEACREANGIEFACLDWQGVPGRNQFAALRIAKEGDAWLKVFERPRPGFKYIMPVDPATGRTVSTDPDNHAAHVYRLGYRDQQGRWNPLKLVARLADCGEEMSEYHKSGKLKACCRWDLDILENRVKLLSDWFGRCMIAPEANKEGGLIRNLMKDGYPVVRMQKYNKATQKLEDYFGFDTDEESRDRIISATVAAVRNNGEDGDGIEILDDRVVQEFKVFSRLKTGRVEAAAGWHDDQVIAPAIAIECREQATLMREIVVHRTDELQEIESRRSGGRRNLTYC